ncbi:MAG: PaaI family thioesterase [Thermoleophilaceae bacterium]|jgi:acyl-coenzyme A thioesterase PaaI-like protein|nr:PaaI family thioesterase [Thermoleophilaceae bacterium]
MTLTHHELCFGCGIANLFGLQMEVEPAEGGEGVSGRFFVKQDHQGPPGLAHSGVLACALDEAMALCVLAEGEGEGVRTGRLEVDYVAPAPVGTFVRVDARVERREERRLEVGAEARGVGGERMLIAKASARFDRIDGNPGEAR